MAVRPVSPQPGAETLPDFLPLLWDFKVMKIIDLNVVVRILRPVTGRRHNQSHLCFPIKKLAPFLNCFQ